MCAGGACGSIWKGDGERDGGERGERLETCFGIANRFRLFRLSLGESLSHLNFDGAVTILICESHLHSIISFLFFVKWSWMANLLYALMFPHELLFQIFFFIPSTITPLHHRPHDPLLIYPHDRHCFPYPTCCYLPYTFIVSIPVPPIIVIFSLSFSLSAVLLGFLVRLWHNGFD